MSSLPLKGESLKIILIVILGWSGFSFADAITKYLTAGFSPALILVFSGVFSGGLLVAYILFDRGWRGFLSPNWKWLIVRAVCIAVTATGVVNAVALIPLADIYGITFSAPFITVVLAFTFLKEQVGWHRWLSVILGFIGVFILAGPQFEHFNMGIVYAIAAMLSIAVGTIVIRKIGSAEYLPLFILYPYLGILAVNVPLAYGEITMPPFPIMWGFIANAIFVLIAQLLVTYATANAKATASIAPFVYVQVIWGVAFGYFVFKEIPTHTTIAGLTLIVGAGIYMIIRERQLNKKNIQSL